MAWKRIQQTSIYWHPSIVESRVCLCRVPMELLGSTTVLIEVLSAEIVLEGGRLASLSLSIRTSEEERRTVKRMLLDRLGRLTDQIFFPELRIESIMVGFLIAGSFKISSSGRATERAMEVFVRLVQAIAEGGKVSNLHAPRVMQTTFFQDGKGHRKDFGQWLADHYYSQLASITV